jgi:hypothetical protein
MALPFLFAYLYLVVLIFAKRCDILLIDTDQALKTDRPGVLTGKPNQRSLIFY